MAADTPDPRKPRLRAVQIKGDQDDSLLIRLEAFATRRGLQQASAARMLLKAALDAEERRQNL